VVHYRGAYTVTAPSLYEGNMNDILPRQNQDRYLTYLAAQRQLYDEEKTRLTIWLVVVSCIAIIGTGALAALTAYAPLITLLSVLIVGAEFAVLPSLRRKRTNAAKIQELFDCEVLHLEWNDTLGTKPPPDIVTAAAQRFRTERKPEEWEALKDWYTKAIGEMPLVQARVYCQRENIWWDSRQRRAYAQLVYSIIAGIAVVLLVVGLVLNVSLQQFFTVPVLLTLPAFAVALKHAYDHQRAANRLDELWSFAQVLKDEADKPGIDPAGLTRRSRDLQNEIFHHRTENPPVFSWFYRRSQPENEVLVESAIDIPPDTHTP
jgi:hypothetical protein